MAAAIAAQTAALTANMNAQFANVNAQLANMNAQLANMNARQSNATAVDQSDPITAIQDAAGVGSMGFGFPQASEWAGWTGNEGFMTWCNC